MAITGNPLIQPQQSNWISELINKNSQRQGVQTPRIPAGFEFTRDPFDPSSYYKQVGSFRDISRAGTEVVLQEQVNKQNALRKAEADRNQKALQEALKKIDPSFTGSTPYGGGGGGLNLTLPSGKSKKYGLKGVTANTGKAADYWGSKYGITSIGGYREHGSVPGSDHPKGRGLDYMTNNLKNGMQIGTALANDLIKNYKAWNIKYVIWNRHIWSPGRGWRKYSGPSNHTDHVHASFNS